MITTINEQKKTNENMNQLSENDKIDILKDFKEQSGGYKPNETLQEWENKQDKIDNIPTIQNYIDYALNKKYNSELVTDFLTDEYLKTNENQLSVFDKQTYTRQEVLILLEDVYCKVAGMVNDYGKSEYDYVQESEEQVNDYMKDK